MRRYRRRNRKNKIIIVSMCLVLILMTAGYAAMQTNIGINAKDNVLQNTIDITDNIVDSGDGLYIDTYEEGRYVYKGANPNNYVSFNNELWRIISIETDGTIKIIRNQVLSEQAWDTTNNNNWARPATLNTYLNGPYYNGLSSAAQGQIQSYTWYIGAVTIMNADLAAQITDEKSSQWSGKVGLITVSDYLRANTNTEQCGNFSLNNSNYNTCKDTNWMCNNDIWWPISPFTSSTSGVLNIGGPGYVEGTGANNSGYAPRPSVYLSSDIKITSGDGSENNPYILEI